MPSKRARRPADDDEPGREEVSSDAEQTDSTDGTDGSTDDEQPEDEAPATTFRSLGLQPWLVDTLRAVHITRPTPVQAACVPAILAGRDVVASAETGTGKTAAFVLPILQHLSRDPFTMSTLILTPTRELAFQISHQVAALSARLSLRHYVLVGGVHHLHQTLSLSRLPHILVATPGRLAHLLARQALDLSRLRFLVLDEADRLLHPTYLDHLSPILDACSSPRRQTLMFSATMTPTMDVMQKSLSPASSAVPFRFDARSNPFATVSALRQVYLFTPHNLKEAYLVHLLKTRYPTSSVIIFVSRCSTAQLLLSLLNLLAMRKVTTIHSEMSQSDRLDALHKFKNASVRALIATDLASRGLDVPHCDLVLNYDLPRSVSTYVHRVGRTARAGRAGRAISFVAQHDVSLLHAIEQNISKKLDKHEPIPDDDVLQELSATLKAKQVASLSLHDSGFMQRYKDRRADARSLAKKRKKRRNPHSPAPTAEPSKRLRPSAPSSPST